MDFFVKLYKLLKYSNKSNETQYLNETKNFENFLGELRDGMLPCWCKFVVCFVFHVVVVLGGTTHAILWVQCAYFLFIFTKKQTLLQLSFLFWEIFLILRLLYELCAGGVFIYSWWSLSFLLLGLTSAISEVWSQAGRVSRYYHHGLWADIFEVCVLYFLRLNG
jgi:hypothetical protein